jgi:hypothetical protein
VAAHEKLLQGSGRALRQGLCHGAQPEAHDRAARFFGRYVDPRSADIPRPRQRRMHDGLHEGSGERGGIRICGGGGGAIMWNPIETLTELQDKLLNNSDMKVIDIINELEECKNRLCDMLLEVHENIKNAIPSVVVVAF